MHSAKEVVHHMMTNDAFSQWLGIEVLANEPGKAELKMTVLKEMTNGFGIAHGGITYSLADSALAFAANGYGIQGVSIETNISHTQPVKAGDVLTTQVEEKNKTRKIGLYEVSVYNQEKVLVALFKGTVYFTGKEWKI
jgi:acyl-CoA thioesterase